MRFPWSRPPAEDVAAPVTEGPRLFSTDIAGRKRAAVQQIVSARLKAARPKVAAGQAMAMDAMELDSVTLDNSIAPTIADAIFAWCGMQGFIGYQTCALLAQHWLIDKACDMPARDAIRHGYDLSLGDLDDAQTEIATKAIRRADKRFRVRKNLRDFVNLGRRYGIRVVLFKVRNSDPKYYENPFNPDGVAPGTYEGMVQIDPYWMVPQFGNLDLNDPTSADFYEPRWWAINGKLYHKSHLCIFRTTEPADLLKPSYQYGGVPIPQMVMERVFAAESAANEAPQLAKSKRLTVWNTDLAHVLANQEKFSVHMQNFVAYQDNYGVKMIDSEDLMNVHDTTLAGLGDLIGGQYELVAAAARVPVTKLLGTTPKGMNSSGGYEESSYHEELETIQESDLTPLLDRHHSLLARSEIEPLLKMTPGSLTIDHEWEPLDSPTAAEYADIAFTKAQTDDLLQTAGAIDGEDIRNRIRSEPNSGYTGLKGPAPEPVEEPAPAAGGIAKPTPKQPGKPAETRAKA